MWLRPKKLGHQKCGLKLKTPWGRFWLWGSTSCRSCTNTNKLHTFLSLIKDLSCIDSPGFTDQRAFSNLPISQILQQTNNDCWGFLEDYAHPCFRQIFDGARDAFQRCCRVWVKFIWRWWFVTQLGLCHYLPPIHFCSAVCQTLNTMSCLGTGHTCSVGLGRIYFGCAPISETTVKFSLYYFRENKTCILQLLLCMQILASWNSQSSRNCARPGICKK